MSISRMINAIKKHPEYSKAGMILCHNGVVRESSRDGREVSGLRVSVDSEKLNRIITEQKKVTGIVEIFVEIFADKDLMVGDDVMHLVVAGDIRENVIKVLSETLDLIKTTVTKKTEFFV